MVWRDTWIACSNHRVPKVYATQFCPPFSPTHIPTNFFITAPLSTSFLFFPVLTYLAHLFFLPPHTSQSTSIWLYAFLFFVYFLSLFTVVLLPGLFLAITRSLLPLSKASITSILSSKKFQFLMPFTFPTFFFLTLLARSTLQGCKKYNCKMLARLFPIYFSTKEFRGRLDVTIIWR